MSAHATRHKRVSLARARTAVRIAIRCAAVAVTVTAAADALARLPPPAVKKLRLRSSTPPPHQHSFRLGPGRASPSQRNREAARGGRGSGSLSAWAGPARVGAAEPPGPQASMCPRSHCQWHGGARGPGRGSWGAGPMRGHGVRRGLGSVWWAREEPPRGLED
jgi:hypothetical protein